MKKIGLTTTVPIEVLLTAGYTPIDLNNVFVGSTDYSKYIDLAEKDGFPKSLCAWIKGIYGACISNNIKEIVGVHDGDCSNTKALTEVLSMKGIKVYPFSYPSSHSLKDVKRELDNFMDLFHVTLEEVEKTRAKLNKLRKLGIEIDTLTFEDNKATALENHIWQISFSDLNGDANNFNNDLITAIESIKKREPYYSKLRLGYIGVPPMTTDIYDFVTNFDSKIVYNEVQREFAFPRALKAKNIYEQYLDYTYPYDVYFRIEEINKQIKKRQIDGIIHYTQAFCYRTVQDIVIKEKLNVPVINIEGDRLNHLDARTKLRLEAFLDMLLDAKEGIF
ncbi:2-hydroxyacyl-CoA dehydratase family protein [Clostridium felsineum]|uniref:2-hydroxyacyl-CoA dehydratase family protein n=1 Tax=Clostridium felsineum TaxID=36839 RepID=UPI00098CC969|nr:2-hydroxyacyl-CoA dehydratase [Clostridium felsineum]URZ02926.1 hypothetical protein CLAUR_029600 [Clostridium felsineum]